jgi:hypothetical protein
VRSSGWTSTSTPRPPSSSSTGRRDGSTSSSRSTSPSARSCASTAWRCWRHGGCRDLGALRRHRPGRAEPTRRTARPPCSSRRCCLSPHAAGSPSWRLGAAPELDACGLLRRGTLLGADRGADLLVVVGDGR